MTFCERLRWDCVQNTEKSAFGPEKTRSKMPLIGSFVARVNQESNPWVERDRPAIGRCSAFSKNNQEIKELAR